MWSIVASGGVRFFRVYAQVSHEPLEAPLVLIVILPAGEVTDITLATQETSPTLRSLHHRVI
jgi:hypothetical protein